MRERTLRHFPEGTSYLMGGHSGSVSKVKKGLKNKKSMACYDLMSRPGLKVKKV
jgi:hypothetical protein